MYDEDDLISWLLCMTEEKASDIYLTVGMPPQIRGDYGFRNLDEKVVSLGDVNTFVGCLLLPDQHSKFNATREFNMSLNIGEGGRYRINLMYQMGVPAIVIRRISLIIPTLDDLGLPEFLGKMCCEPRGLILVVGATGSGKSTSLAAMIDYRNRNKSGHILTVEDPIEYIHQHKKCIISQREVGTDTDSFNIALKNALRQHPDVILVGEIRDQETMTHAMNISETGHLALATLHANSASQAIERVLTFFPHDQREQVLMTLSFNLKGVLSQRLVHTKSGSRTAVLEIMLNEGDIVQLVREGKSGEIKKTMEKYGSLGMQTFDNALAKLYADNVIEKEVAISESDNKVELIEKLDKIDKEKSV